MGEVEDRLLPKDGLNNYHVVLARMDLPAQGGGHFTFAVTNSMLPVTELLVNVPASGQSLDRMTVEAHDQLIDILRQLIFRADKGRGNHEKNTPRPAAPAPFRLEDSGELEFVLDRRTRPERRPEPQEQESDLMA